MHQQTITISSVGQITIPRNVRKILGIEKGDKLDFEIDEKKKSITLKKQPTVDEVFARLEKLSKSCPKLDPRTKYMTVGEMSLEEAKNIKGDTWI